MMNMKMAGAALLAGAMVVGCTKNAEEAARAGNGEAALTVNGQTLTKGQIAWGGYSPKDPMASQYAWRIVNPNPDEEVEFLEIRSPLEKGWRDRWGNPSALAIIAVTLEVK